MHNLDIDSSNMRSCQQVLPTVHNFRGPTPNTGDTQFILSSTSDSPQMIHRAFSSAFVTYFLSQCAVSCCVFFVDWLFIRFTVLPFFGISALFLLQSIRERIHFQHVLFLEFSLCQLPLRIGDICFTDSAV